MQQNPLIKALASLPRKKVTRFKEFALSPYFNKHQEVANLAVFLSGIYPDFSEKKCHREAVFKTLYPTLPHDQQKLAIVFTYATRLLEDFLRIEEAIQKGALQDDSLLTAQLREHGLLFYLQKFYKENNGGGNNDFGKSVNSNLPPTAADLQKMAEMDATSLALSDLNTTHLNTRQQALDDYFLFQKLKDACELLQRGKMTKQPYSPTPMLATVLGALETRQIAVAPAVRLVHHLYKMLRDDDADGFDQLVGLLESGPAPLHHNDLAAVFSHLQNFCIGQINTGRKDFLSKLFQIYRSQLDRNLLLDNGFLPEWHFKNITTTALRLNEHQWARDFIETYQGKLKPDVRENAVRYNLAAYHYYMGDPGRVLPLLVKVEYTDLRYNLDAKALLLRTYFDLDEEEALHSLAETFRQFLLRNKELTSYQKSGYFNLLKLTRRAFRLKSGKGFIGKEKWETNLLQLKAVVTATEPVFNKGWLEEKIAELSGKDDD